MMILNLPQIAVEGCCHGCLDDIYDEIARMEQNKSFKIDLLLVCGDFEAVRSHSDLQCMAVPNKYKELGSFHKCVLALIHLCIF